MKNKILRKSIKFLFSFMGDTTRDDIYNKYETVADIAYTLPYTTSDTRIKDLSTQVKK